MNALIQNGTNEHALLLKWATGYHKNYCEYHGMDYRFGFTRLQERHSYWDKVIALRKWINDPTTKEGDIAVWLDCDALWILARFFICSALSDGYNLGAVKGNADYYNTGCLWIRCCPAMKDFLDRWYWHSRNKSTHPAFATFRFNDYGWYDQAAFNWIVSMEQVEGIVIQELDSRFNNWPNKKYLPSEETVVKAFHGGSMRCIFRDFPRVLGTLGAIGGKRPDLLADSKQTGK